ncbi:hypothetical protein UFOVP1230_45 [uncultured Caudovirales phage]|uniref:Uncharacterized protein n=1 Tax=uncultured Caudovirales phage TaxID=2100421 RepID=A0A6J5R4V4_9CAUD|nr:hypothetical protein UFOVP1230_45 [uncultured Caudovirales phage]|tara:strand:+ start:2185 stop:2397 length:213 start_codon:yes stop_codon:yes gene_type:complete
MASKQTFGNKKDPAEIRPIKLATYIPPKMYHEKFKVVVADREETEAAWIREAIIEKIEREFGNVIGRNKY